MIGPHLLTIIKAEHLRVREVIDLSDTGVLNVLILLRASTGSTVIASSVANEAKKRSR